jgi:hypothetical protein
MRRLSSRGAVAVAFGLAVFFGSTVVAGADTTPSGGSGRLAGPNQMIDGLSGGDVMGEGWYTELSLPTSANPFFGKGDRCLTLGRTGGVLLALSSEPVSCTVEQGTTVFVIGITGFCDNVEPPPFFGADEAAQRECILALLDQDVTGISLTVDGGEPVDLHVDSYLTCSPQRQVQLPKNNLLKVKPQPMTFTACGWVAWLKDLPVGLHTIRSLATFTDGTSHLYQPDIEVIP